MWQSIVNGILGIWLIISAFIVKGLGDTGNLWNYLIVGIIVAVLGFWGASGKNQ